MSLSYIDIRFSSLANEGHSVANDGLRQAKEVAVREYRDSDALLSELGDSFLQGFDDALHQV